MTGFSRDGLTLTYVTDPALSPGEQRRILLDFVRCARDQELRVAFRLPELSDRDLALLVDWYFVIVADEGMKGHLLPPLIHNRSQIAEHYPYTRSWLPSRQLGSGVPADAYSVHSLDEAHWAIAQGTGEVIFGHVFPTESHPGEEGRGIAALQEILALQSTHTNITVTAIGGMDSQSIQLIGHAGERNVACIRAISRSPDIAETLAAVRQSWEPIQRDLIEKGTHDDEQRS